MQKFIYIIILSIFLSTNVRAEEVNNIIVNENSTNCESLKNMILEELKKPMECFIDQECQYFDYGYPFQPDVCTKAIISTQEQDKVLANIKNLEKFYESCIANNEKERELFDKFDAELDEQKTNNTCSLQRVLCYKGFCRNSTYPIYNNE